jgi:hypothetical protein
MPVIVAIRIFSGLLAILGGANLVVLALSEHLQSAIPWMLHPAATFSQALALFGVGASVHALSEMAGKRSGKSGGH